MKNKKIKIAHIIEGFTGGTKTYLINVLPQLAANNFDVTLICSLGRCDPDWQHHLGVLKKHNIKVHTIPMKKNISPVFDLYCFILIIKILRKNNFDIIHTHCSKAGTLARLAAFFSETKTIFHCSHCFAFLRTKNQFAGSLYLTIERSLAHLTTKYIAVSNADYRSAIDHHIFTPQRSVIINNALTIDYLPRTNFPPNVTQIAKKSLNLPTNSKIVTTACRLVEYKGIFTLINAAALTKTNVILLIAGRGPLEPAIRAFIEKNNLADKVKLTGYIRNKKLLYQVSDAVILCSRVEAQPYLLLEAMRAKCPIIATDVPGNCELIANDRAIPTSDSPQQIAMAIDRIFSDKNITKLCTENAYQYFLKHHDIKDQIEKLTATYVNSLLQNP